MTSISPAQQLCGAYFLRSKIPVELHFTGFNFPIFVTKIQIIFSRYS